MDNYFPSCPPMMSDGRNFTDYRSSQSREAYFRYKNCVNNENAARNIRIDRGAEIMDKEWDHLTKTNWCFPQKKCFHNSPTSRTSTQQNIAELMAYNGFVKAPECHPSCYSFRMTVTPGSARGRKNCKTVTPRQPRANNNKPRRKCPEKCPNKYPRSTW